MEYSQNSLSDDELYDFERIFPTNLQSYSNNNCLTTPNNDSWRKTPILQWDKYQVFEWIMDYVGSKHIFFEDLCMENFHVIADGTYLCNMTITDFVCLDPKYGRLLYEGVQDYFQNQNIFNILPLRFDISQPPSPKEDILLLSDMTNKNSKTAYSTEMQSPESTSYYTISELQNIPNTIIDLENYPKFSSLLPSSDDEGNSSDSSNSIPTTIIRRRGRPKGSCTTTQKKDKGIKMGLLWEFIRGLLHNPAYCPSLIKWENHDEGVFRFVRTERIAELWGSRKSNTKMNYEKLSRALRYYYKTNVFQPVLGRRLVYKFGPSAHGWRTSNPNFEN